MTTGNKSIYLIFLVLLTVSGFVYFNNLILRLSTQNMNEQSYIIQFDNNQTSRFAGMSNKLNLSILRFDDYYESDPQLLAYEARNNIFETTEEEPFDLLNDIDWDVKLVKQIGEVLSEADEISLEERQEFFDKLGNAFLLLRAKDFELVATVYTELLEKETLATEENIRIPLFIFRAYSFFMINNVQASLEDLFAAKDFQNDVYNPTIFYMLERIYKLLELRGVAYAETDDLRRGIFLFKTYDFAASETLLTEYIENPENKNREDALYYLGRIQEEKGNYDLANRIYKYLIESPGAFEEATLARLFIIYQYHSEDEEKAQEYFQRLSSTYQYVLDLRYSGDFDESLSDHKLTLMSKLTDADYVGIYETTADLEAQSLEQLLLQELSQIAELSVVTADPAEVFPDIPIDTPDISPTIPDSIVDPVDVVLLPEPPEDTLPMLTEKEVIEYRIETIKEEVAILSQELDEIREGKQVRDTTAIVSYTGGAISTGVAAYQGFQAYQTWSLVNSGIDPSTVQGVNTDLSSLLGQLAITGGISLAAYLLGGGLNIFDAVNDTEGNISRIENVLDNLEAEKATLEQSLD